MTIRQWVDLAKTVDVDGLEFYSGFAELAAGPAAWKDARQVTADKGLEIPMLCCSPDFTHPDPVFRQNQIDKQRGWIDMAAGLGAKFCRVLSGQRRPELSRDDGLRYAADSIRACLPTPAPPV